MTAMQRAAYHNDLQGLQALHQLKCNVLSLPAPDVRVLLLSLLSQ